jgi:hypothetical protein
LEARIANDGIAAGLEIAVAITAAVLDDRST